MGKKKSSGGGGNALADVPSDLVDTTVDVLDESFDVICARHAHELARIESHVSTFGNGKRERERAMRAVGVVSDRHYREMSEWERAHEDDAEETVVREEEEGETAALAEALAVGAALEPTPASTTDDGAMIRKPSKAMARKAKRAAEEAAREARIEAEKAALGPSDEAVESDVLRARLAPLGLKVKEIRADGHCLYRSIDDQLRAMTGAGREGGYEGLRVTCAETMRDDESAYRPFVDECAEDTPEADARWEAYVRDVESTATWGGQLEIMALAKALKRRIQVFSATMPVVVMGEEFEDAPPLRVCYHRHAFGLGEHYNSVE